MSLAAVLWVNNLRLDVVKGSARAVLSLLADRANHDGTSAWPSAKELAATLGVTVRTIRRHLVELEDMGLIRRGDQRFVEHIRADRRPVVWDIAVMRPVDNHSPRGDRDVTPQAPRGDIYGPNGVTPGVPHTEEPSKNRPTTRERGARAHVRPVDNAPAPTSIPDGWTPTDRHARRAQQRGVDVAKAAEAFVAHARANGRRLVDWDAGFDLWLTRARPPGAPFLGQGRPTARSGREERLARADEAIERVAQMQHEQHRHLVGIEGGA